VTTRDTLQKAVARIREFLDPVISGLGDPAIRAAIADALDLPALGAGTPNIPGTTLASIDTYRDNTDPDLQAFLSAAADIVTVITAVRDFIEAGGVSSGQVADKIDALLELLRPLGVQEVVRTGKVAISRGPKTRVKRPTEARRPRVSDDPRVVGFAD
jgi:hypothetical protein